MGGGSILLSALEIPERVLYGNTPTPSITNGDELETRKK